MKRGSRKVTGTFLSVQYLPQHLTLTPHLHTGYSHWILTTGHWNNTAELLLNTEYWTTEISNTEESRVSVEPRSNTCCTTAGARRIRIVWLRHAVFLVEPLFEGVRESFSIHSVHHQLCERISYGWLCTINSSSLCSSVLYDGTRYIVLPASHPWSTTVWPPTEFWNNKSS